MTEKLKPFIYLLNAFEAAAQSANPAEERYGEKRTALLDHVRQLEESSEMLDYIADRFVSCDFADAKGVLLSIEVPKRTSVSVDFKQTVARAMEHSKFEDQSAPTKADAPLSVLRNGSPDSGSPNTESK